MTRYYFDIDDGLYATEDRDGVDYPGLDAAKLAAIRTATSIACDLSISDGARVTVKVRNSAQLLFEAVVTLQLSDHPPDSG
jgi:hypothetical protein